MKRAYVKPVFLAEAFEGTASVASCQYHSGVAGNEVLIYNGLRLCSSGNNCSHKVGGNNGGKLDGDIQNYWDYATNNGVTTPPTNNNYANNGVDGAYLFTDGHTVCDFVWNGGNSQVGIWTDSERNAISDAGSRNPMTSIISWISESFSAFFGIQGSGSDQHKPGVNHQQFFS